MRTDTVGLRGKHIKALTTLIAVAITLTLAMVASANEVAVNIDSQTGKTCIEVNLAKNFGKSPFGMFAYAAQTKGWSEAYVGHTLSAPHFQVGVAAGIESNQPSVRFGGFVWAGHKQFSILALGEDGGSGVWYRMEAKYALDGKTTIGILQEINKGTGILIERKLDKEITLRLRLYNGGKGDVGIKLAF